MPSSLGNSPVATNARGHRVAVRVVYLARVVFVARIQQLVSGGQDGDDRAANHARAIESQGRQHAYLRRTQRRSRFQDSRPRLNVLPSRANVRPEFDRNANAYLLHALARFAAFRLVSLLERHNRVRPFRNRRARHNPHSGSRRYRLAGQLPRRDVADHLEQRGSVLRRAGHIGGLDRVPVHSRIVQRRNISRRSRVLRENLPQRVQQRNRLRVQRLEVRQDAIQRLFHRQHRRQIVAMPMPHPPHRVVLALVVTAVPVTAVTAPAMPSVPVSRHCP